MPVKTRVIHSTNAFGALEIPCTSGLRIVGVHPVMLNNRVGVITYLGARRCWGGNVAIGVRELRQNASRYLEEVAAGESFEITDRGHPVARLVPIGPASGDPRRGAGCPCVATAVDERHRGLRERPAESVGVQSRNAAVTGRRIGYLLHCRPYRPARTAQRHCGTPVSTLTNGQHGRPRAHWPICQQAPKTCLFDRIR